MGNQRAEVFELLVFCTEKGSLIWRLDRQQDQIRGSTIIGHPIFYSAKLLEELVGRRAKTPVLRGVAKIGEN